MGKEILNVDSVLEWCPCEVGCHLCSGTGRFLKPVQVKELYRYWRTDLNGSFQNFMFVNRKEGLYEISDETINKLSEWNNGATVPDDIYKLRDKKIVLMNVPIMTQDGTYRKSQLAQEDANWLLTGKPIVSAIGHQGTADVLTTIFHRFIPVNRINFMQELDTIAIVLKMHGRLPEGVILNQEEMEKIGYNFFLVERLT
jgi:hypothetical protein